MVLRDGRLEVRETTDPQPEDHQDISDLLVPTRPVSMEQVHATAGHTLHRLINRAIAGLIMAADNKSGANPVGFHDDAAQVRLTVSGET